MNAPMPIGPNAKPENIAQNPNVMYQGAILYSPPHLGYYWAWIALHEPDRLPRMLKKVGEMSAKFALGTFEAAIKAMGAKEPGPEQRLMLYRRKPIELWMEQQAKFPWRYEHDMQDWLKLEATYGVHQPEPQSTLAEVKGQPVMARTKVTNVQRDGRGRITRIEEAA